MKIAGRFPSFVENVTRVKLIKLVLTCFTLSLLALSSFADVTIETDGTDAANLTKITVDGVEHTAFIGANVTEFSMYGANGRTTQLYTNGGSAAVGVNAANPLEDISLSTGYTALRNLSFDFDNAVVNRDGADIVIFEINPSETSYLTLNVTIGGTTINFGSSGNPFIDSGIIGKIRLSEGPYLDIATTLAELEAIPSFATYGSILELTIGYLGVDLSDFGIADGASVSSISIAGHTGTADGQYDITGIVAIPEAVKLGTIITIK